MNFYVIKLITTSKGAEDRSIDPYDSYEPALRQFHKIMQNVGTGPLKVSSMLIDSDLNIIKKEIWREPQPEPQTEPETTQE